MKIATNASYKLKLAFYAFPLYNSRKYMYVSLEDCVKRYLMSFNREHRSAMRTVRYVKRLVNRLLVADMPLFGLLDARLFLHSLLGAAIRYRLHLIADCLTNHLRRS